ncbi:TraX family protein [Enterococcus moraviensis]|uniref:TraX family protein n=1 Tax=Enterococcus moraviensis TaxID=155617 RepID=UPI0024AE9BE6|nr:TraX family protein [Enterococcus moraviensis]
MAVSAMLINHIGILFEWGQGTQMLPFFAISEFVGRFTFPIMAYLLVEGCHYSKNLKKYVLRLTTFWIISIYPFYLLHNQDYSFSITDVPNNIFFTLLMGLLMMIYYGKTKNSVLHFFIVILFAAFSILSDWNVVGVLLIWALYKFHNDKGIKITMLVYFVLFEVLSIIGLLYSTNTLAYIVELISPFGFLAVGYILLHYNGKRGYSPNWVKWGFYAFYPVHIIVLEVIRYLIL